MGERRCRRVRVHLRAVTHHAPDRWAGDVGPGGRSRIRSGGGCAGSADSSVACVTRVGVLLRLSPRPGPTVAAPGALDEHAHHGTVLAVAKPDALKRAVATASTPAYGPMAYGSGAPEPRWSGRGPSTPPAALPEAVPLEPPQRHAPPPSCGACPDRAASRSAWHRGAPAGRPRRAGRHARARGEAWPPAGALGGAPAGAAPQGRLFFLSAKLAPGAAPNLYP